MQAHTSPIAASPENLKVINALVTTSMRSSMELDTILPWADGVDKTMLPRKPEHGCMYGTKYWDMMSQEQQLEVLWLETARDITSFVKLERFIPVLYMSYLNRYGDALPKEIYDYMAIFSKEEVVHTLVFNRFLQVAELPSVQDPDSAYMEFVQTMHERPPVFGIFLTLFIEWIAELNAIFNTQFEGAEPLTKKMFREHHVEEVRHIAFGKRIVESFVETGKPEEVNLLRTIFKPAIQNVFDELRFNRMIGDYTSFKFPIDKNDKDAINEVRNSAHNQKMHSLRFKEFDDWLVKLGFDMA